MNIKVELALEVMGAEFAKTDIVSGPLSIIWLHALCLVPGDNVTAANLPHPREKGQGGEDERGEDRLVVIQRCPDGGLRLQWLAPGS